MRRSFDQFRRSIGSWLLLRPALLLVLASALGTGARAELAGTAFSYQGHLTDKGLPANGLYDLQFSLWDAVTAGNQVGDTVALTALGITNGLFAVELDFGSAPFGGDERWLQVGVRQSGSAADFTVLSPRQRLSPHPYALFAFSAREAVKAQTMINGQASNLVVMGATVSGLTNLDLVEGRVVIGGPGGKMQSADVGQDELRSLAGIKGPVQVQLDAISSQQAHQAQVVLNSMADLKVLAGGPGTMDVTIRGYYAPGDGGGGDFYWDAASVEADDGGAVIQPVTGGNGRWRRLRSGCVSVKWFGAWGDGFHDDTLAIRAALGAAGPYGSIIFPSGSTFLLKGSLRPQMGQTLYGYGAKLTRAPQVHSTTMTATEVGTIWAVEVTDPTVFSVGQDVTFFLGEQFDTSNKTIVAIVGDLLFLQCCFQSTLPPGATVVSSFTQIFASASVTGVKVLGFELDGNRAENSLFKRWENNAEICLGGNGSLVRDCYIHDAQAEGIICGGQGTKVLDNRLINCGGNGIHLSGYDGVEIRGNYVKNCNLDGSVTGHLNGCIAFSYGTNNTIVANNYLENGFEGIGNIAAEVGSQVIMAGNTITNCRTAIKMEIVHPGLSAGRVVLTGNQVYSCGSILLNNETIFQPPVGAERDVLIQGNYIYNTPLVVHYSGRILIADNVITGGANTDALVGVGGSEGVSVNGNILTGGRIGIYFVGYDYRRSEGLSAGNNTLLEQTGAAIYLDGADLYHTQIHHNTILAKQNIAWTNYVGIILAEGSLAEGNALYLDTGQCGIAMPKASPRGAGAIAMNNTVVTPSGVPSFLLRRESTGNYILNNVLAQPVSDSSDGSANSIAGNVILGSASGFLMGAGEGSVGAK